MCQKMRKGDVLQKLPGCVLEVRWRDDGTVARFTVSAGEYSKVSVGRDMIEALPPSARGKAA
jgi:hypothetical protein